MPRLSVIVPTRNRAALLAATLDSLTRQSLPPADFEIIVVDDGSTDDTAAVVDSFGPRLPALRRVPTSARGLHEGRHAGLREARGEILVYADDDIEALPSWLEAVARAFDDPVVVLVGGNDLPRFCSPPAGWLLRMWSMPHPVGGHAIPALSIIQVDGPARPLPPAYVWGCNFSIRKEVLLEAGGFHPDGMPNDLLHLRGDGESHVARHVAEHGLVCRFEPGASVYHSVTADRMTFAYFRARGFRQGISDSYSALRVGHAPSPWQWRLRQAVRAARRGMQALLAADPEVHRAQFELAAGHAAGYAHHQRLYRQSAELRAWVHKPTYL